MGTIIKYLGAVIMLISIIALWIFFALHRSLNVIALSALLSGLFIFILGEIIRSLNNIEKSLLKEIIQKNADEE